MNQYESVIVLTPLLSEEVAKEAFAKFKAVLTDNGAEIVAEDSWGLRKLAYSIAKKASGHFFLVEYKSQGDLISKLELALKRDERVLRFMTTSLDRHAIAYNEKKRSGAFNKKPKKEEAAV
ncbi:MAG: 30S ribosomal protein S6 [Pedobacter sp.]|nr:MAG: 30S ribosomal protein S6 [Pedobacter sp.]